MKKQTNKTENRTTIELKKLTVLTFENMKNVKGGVEHTCATDKEKSQQGGI